MTNRVARKKDERAYGQSKEGDALLVEDLSGSEVNHLEKRAKFPNGCLTKWVDRKDDKTANTPTTNTNTQRRDRRAEKEYMLSSTERK